MDLGLSLTDFFPLLVVAIAGFLFCAGVYPFYIKWLKSKQVEQFIREEGPQSHAVKAKTPTMGGVGFIIGTLLATGLAVYKFGLFASPGLDPSFVRNSLITIGLSLAAGLGCAALGIADDYGKVRSKSNKGLSARFRLFSELAIGLVIGLTLLLLKIPFADLIVSVNPMMDNAIGVFHMPQALAVAYALAMVPFLVAATSNAINLHDGMDGLAGGTTFICFSTLAFMLYVSNKPPLAWVAAATAGCLLAFLIYNRYPAKVFMGDTGSLFLGGLMAGLVVCGGLTLWFIPLSLIYIVESLSVMAQIAYFKLTKPYEPEKPMSASALAIYKLTHRLPGDGKRLLRMAPIHHHFEAVAAEKGKPEWQVVLWFWLIQLGIASAVCLGFSHSA